jgi:hypothetical protein
MVPWNRLPHEVQRVLLVLAVAASGTTSASCCFPRVCDPAPPPKVSPTPTWPRVCDPPPPPPRTATPGLTVTPTSTVTPTQTITPTLTITPGAGRSATPPPVICDPAPPPARVTPNTMVPNALPGAVLLPLAELRSVDVVWSGGLTFGATTPWPGARYRWTASVGSLATDGERAAWQAPAQAGRYLVQVAADWGRDGLAVDAVVLVVADDGNVSFG